MYPTLGRVSPNQAQAGLELATFMQNFKWTKAALITNSLSFTGTSLRTATQQAFAKANISLAVDIDLTNVTANGESVLQLIKSSARSALI